MSDKTSAEMVNHKICLSLIEKLEATKPSVNIDTEWGKGYMACHEDIIQGIRQHEASMGDSSAKVSDPCGRDMPNKTNKASIESPASSLIPLRRELIKLGYSQEAAKAAEQPETVSRAAASEDGEGYTPSPQQPVDMPMLRRIIFEAICQDKSENIANANVADRAAIRVMEAIAPFLKREIGEGDAQVIESHDLGRQEGVRPPALRPSSSPILCEKEVEKVMDAFIREWSTSNLYNAVSTLMKRYKITQIEGERK